jgi:uncharacterized protein YdaU (DUF1376 family)
MHFYQFNIGDYARDTAHLTDMEDLAYRRMLDLYYRTEKPLPSSVDEIARLIRMRSHCDCIATVLQDFFERIEAGYINRRADDELRKVYGKSERARESARARWSKNNDLGEGSVGSVGNANAMRTHSDGNANGMLHITHNTIPNNTIKETVSQKLDFSSWPDMPSDRLMSDWRALRKRLKAGITQTVVNRVGKELHIAVLAGHTVDQCFEQWIYKGWRGFEASWMPVPQETTTPVKQNKLPRAFGE